MSRWVVVAGCTYELGALLTRRYPTFTELCARYPALGPALLGTLAVHLYKSHAPGRRSS